MEQQMEAPEVKLQRPGRKRLAVDVPIHVFQRVIESSHKRNITITKFILQAILEKLATEKFYEY